MVCVRKGGGWGGWCRRGRGGENDETNAAATRAREVAHAVSFSSPCSRWRMSSGLRMSRAKARAPSADCVIDLFWGGGADRGVTER